MLWVAAAGRLTRCSPPQSMAVRPGLALHCTAAQAERTAVDMLTQLKEHLTLAMVPASNMRDWLRVNPRKEQLAGLPPLVELWSQVVSRTPPDAPAWPPPCTMHPYTLHVM